MRNSGINYQGIQPINRFSPGKQVIAGQYKRLGGTNFFKSNTNIQMNFNGVNPFGSYDYGCCCNSKPSFLENLITALGFAGALAGPLIGLFGKKGDDDTVKDNDSKGAKENNVQNNEPANNEQNVEQNQEQKVKPNGNNDGKVNNNGAEDLPDLNGLKEGMPLELHDELGRKATLPIKGKITKVEGDKITLEDSSSGKTNTYVIKATKNAAGAIVSLEVLSKNGKTCTSDNKYEKVDGKWQDKSENQAHGLRFEGDASPASKKSAPTRTATPPQGGNPKAPKARVGADEHKTETQKLPKQTVNNTPVKTTKNNVANRSNVLLQNAENEIKRWNNSHTGIRGSSLQMSASMNQGKLVYTLESKNFNIKVTGSSIKDVEQKMQNKMFENK